MSHKIFVSHTKEQVENLAVRWGLNVVLSVSNNQQLLREAVTLFQRFAPESEVFVVNAEKFTDQNFAVFLKVLEDPNMGGQVWFYGKHLSGYPFTVRSRCETVLVDFVNERDRISDFLTGKEVWAARSYFEMQCLRGYASDFAWEMLTKRDSFIELLLMMDSTNDFLLFQSYLDKVVFEYVYLLVEWYQSNEIFTKTQLDVCPWLHGTQAKSLFEGFMTIRSLADLKFLFLSLLTYRLVYL